MSSLKLMKFTDRLLLIGFCLIPLVYLPTIGYEQTKVLAFILLVNAGLLVWIIQGVGKFKIRFGSINPLFMLSLLFIVVLTTASVLGINPGRSFIGNPPYFQGVLLYLELFIFSILVSRTRLAFSFWALGLSLSAIYISAQAIIEFGLIQFQQPVLTYAGRVISTFGQPNLYSGFLVLILPLSYSLARSKGRLAMIGWVAILLSSVGIVLSFSRAAIAMLGLVFFIWLISQIANKILRWSVCLFALNVVIVSLMLSFYLQSGLFWGEYYLPRTQRWLIDNAPEKRLFIWTEAIEMAQKKPFLGYGLENNTDIFAGFNQDLPSPWYFGMKNLYLDRSHNFFLDLLLSTGIVGVISFLALCFGVVWFCGSSVLRLTLSIFILWSLVQIPSVLHLELLFLMVGLSLGRTSVIDNR